MQYLNTAALSVELFQLHERANHLRYRIRTAKDPNQKAALLYKLQGLQNTQKLMKYHHIALYRKKLELAGRRSLSL